MTKRELGAEFRLAASRALDAETTLWRIARTLDLADEDQVWDDFVSERNTPTEDRVVSLAVVAKLIRRELRGVTR